MQLSNTYYCGNKVCGFVAVYSRSAVVVPLGTVLDVIVNAV